MITNIKIHNESVEKIWHKASEFLINWIHLYHNITQKTLLLLSGGSCVNIYKELAKFLSTSELDFDYLAIAQVDERFQPKQITDNRQQTTKNDINAEVIKETGLWEICSKRNIPYYLVSQEGILEQSAEQYNKIIEKLFKEYVYKVAILGIGEDGHTAGLLPGYEKVWNKDKLVVGYEVDSGQNSARAEFCQKNFKERISLTPKALQQLDQAIIVAVGEKKKRAIIKAFNERNSNKMNEIPAVLIQKIPKVDLFTDNHL